MVKALIPVYKSMKSFEPQNGGEMSLSSHPLGRPEMFLIFCRKSLVLTVNLAKLVCCGLKNGGDKQT